MESENDFQRLRDAISLIEKGNLVKAEPSLRWLFYSTDLEPTGFYQTATRLGLAAEDYKRNVLDRYPLAREFYYSKREYKGEYARVHLEIVK